MASSYSCCRTWILFRKQHTQQVSDIAVSKRVNYWFDYIIYPSFYQSIKHALDTQLKISECFALYERIEFEPVSSNHQTDFESDDIQAIIST